MQLSTPTKQTELRVNVSKTINSTVLSVSIQTQAHKGNKTNKNAPD